MESEDQVRERLKRAIRDYNYKSVNQTFKPFEAMILDAEIMLMGRILELKPNSPYAKNKVYQEIPEG